ncbi:NAD(P)-binding protein [Trichodelitschia bisporula]|uniref:NAD(P)-binding protein n=1 Tax=Trichodelitschia bisporula TaxID=703511 RepID=A0A6G1HR85_9PEZI|nr:NAD(P)-binding protein [Trichodelitschia bisporula]
MAQKVLVLGATGETGREIVNALLAAGTFDVTALVRPSSATKPAVLALEPTGVHLLIASLDLPVETLAAQIKPYHTIISCIGPMHQLAQLPLIAATALAGTQRFVPCGFTTICPPGGVMYMRDEKERVYQALWVAKVPYTIIDVGFWHQISFLTLPSGRSKYAAIFEFKEVYAGGEAKTLLIDKSDVGRFVARIVADERTVNKKVVAWGEERTQREIKAIMEEVSGETLDNLVEVSESQVRANAVECLAAFEAEDNMQTRFGLYNGQYNLSKFVRGDNTLTNALYLGYLDAHVLYPDISPVAFRDYAREIIEGKAVAVYADGFPS